MLLYNYDLAITKQTFEIYETVTFFLMYFQQLYFKILLYMQQWLTTAVLSCHICDPLDTFSKLWQTFLLSRTGLAIQQTL